MIAFVTVQVGNLGVGRELLTRGFIEKSFERIFKTLFRFWGKIFFFGYFQPRYSRAIKLVKPGIVSEAG